ncbi:SUKH-3 domain-containing protein [Cryptosporangium minutisporangium]|uniref:SUKH-3 immunity protein of toxin-antitoxin system n=1 Tax=Cryptosporangium minutisporangium TaxID=113569 RepID=A0ABP6SXZ7_9ACTN
MPAGEVELREFDGGWVAWAVAPGGAGVLPDRIGDARVVVDGASGDLTTWPPLPVEEIIARSRPAPAGRFPEDVEAVLRKAGWYPGRAVPDADLDRYAQRLHDLTADEEPPLGVVDAARGFLKEFGGLSSREHAIDAWHFQPQDEDPAFHLFIALDQRIGQSVTPLGWISSDYRIEISMSADGRVFVGAFSGIYLLAENADWALVRLVRGELGDLPYVEEDGEISYRSNLGDPIDPGSTRGPASGA